MSQLREYLQQKGEAWATLGVHAGKLELWYAENGEDYEWSPRPDDVTPGVAKECYSNAFNLAVERNQDGWRYAEGYVLTATLGMEIHHAWVVKPDGTVVDPTLRDEADTDCPFCVGNGKTEVEVEWDEEDGEAIGWEEEDCWSCGGSGESDEHPAREGTTYVGVTLDLNEIAAALLERGSYGLIETVMDIYATKEG